MSYYKKVLYIDYFENGERIFNAGFVKLMKIMGTDQVCMQIQVQNVPVGWNAEREVWLYTPAFQKREALAARLGSMEINGGRGMLQIKNLADVLPGTVAETLDGRGFELRMELMPGEYLSCRLEGEEKLEGEKKREEEDKKEEVPASEPVPAFASEPVQAPAPQSAPVLELESGPQSDPVSTAESVSQSDSASELESAPQSDSALELDSTPQSDSAPAAESAPCLAPASAANGEQESGLPLTADPGCEPEALHRPRRVHRDKWKQLWENYPHIAPFDDERYYLCLELQDLVILPGKYYRLAENSFLRHGYYNYEHLILARSVRKGVEKYYIGVPGNYYEKEKQVAVYFGFESFEPKAEPAREGDFGYYMIGVDI